MLSFSQSDGIRRGNPTPVNLSETNECYLAFVRDICEVSEVCGTTTYLWGGVSIDVMEGRFVRDHGDVDGFTLDLLGWRDDLAALYEERGDTSDALSYI